MAKTTRAKAWTTIGAGSDLLGILEQRFEQHMSRHRDLRWATVRARLDARPGAWRVLQRMEDTGGEPDVIAHDRKTGEVTFCDCSPESPDGRRSVCYDREGLESRKEHRPATTAIDMASEIGVRLLSEDEYRHLQTLGEFDTKTSSWLQTPAGVRTLGGAIFGDFRYGRVFVYHNGAQSYYASRGFRGVLKV